MTCLTLYNRPHCSAVVKIDNVYFYNFYRKYSKFSFKAMYFIQ